MPTPSFPTALPETPYESWLLRLGKVVGCLGTLGSSAPKEEVALMRCAILWSLPSLLILTLPAAADNYDLRFDASEDDRVFVPRSSSLEPTNVLASLTGATGLHAQSICPGLIENSDFSQGNQGFYSQYTHGCNAEQQYEIVTDANSCNPAWHGFDHTTGAGNFLVVNGAIVADQVVWQQTVLVTPDIEYELSAWITTVESRDLAVLRFLINGTEVASETAPAVVGSWTPLSIVWNSGQDTTATIAIIDETLAYGGNDFGIDDICFDRLTPVAVESGTWGSMKAAYR